MESIQLKHELHRRKPARVLASASGLLLILIMQGGCETQSLREPLWLQETPEGRCLNGKIKQCRVWGGNKFKKRYEYCGCQDR